MLNVMYCNLRNAETEKINFRKKIKKLLLISQTGDKYY